MKGRSLVAGRARAQLLLSHEPLSFWGGYDQESGEIIDRRHPLSGEIAAGKVLALPGSRGSSTTTAVLLEALRSGAAPAAIIVQDEDSFFALASIVADELFGKSIPIVQLPPSEFSKLKNGQWVNLDEDGFVVIEGNGP